MNPEFSVIVPVYNVEKYLDECIRSVISQKDFDSLSVEIVLVNDGSTDNSGRLCDEYAAKYDFIRVVHQENKGLLQARPQEDGALAKNHEPNLRPTPSRCTSCRHRRATPSVEMLHW